MHDATEIDPLIRMAVAHYQFEATHPFTDGNGRTGRILNQLVLVEHGLLSHPVLYLSRFIMRRRAQYYSLLSGVTRNTEWEARVLYMLEGIVETDRWTAGKIEAIRTLMAKTSERVKEKLPKISSRELVEITYVQPRCRIRNVVDAGLAKRQTAAQYLKALTRIGVLEERKVGREKLFLNPALPDLLIRERSSS